MKRSGFEFQITTRSLSQQWLKIMRSSCNNMSEFGLMFYNARWYDPVSAHFSQADSIIPGAGQSQAWDRYSYTQNNPVRYTDPTGHSWTECGDSRSGYRCKIHENQVKKAFAENLREMMSLALSKVDVIYLIGDALDKIKADPNFQDFRSNLIQGIMNRHEFMNETFVWAHTEHVVFGGERDPAPMLLQLLDSHNPEYEETWRVAKNELTWMLREATVSASVNVTSEGKVTIMYEVYDIFDLMPAEGRTMEYNVISGTLGRIWHDQMGASAPEVYAIWIETIAFSVDLSNFP